MNAKKLIVSLVAAAGIVATASGCSTIDTPSDRAALNYNHGPFQALEFDGCVGPNQYEMNAPTDESVSYPAGQRTYTFQRAEQGRDGDMFNVTTSNNISLGVEGVVRFRLNTDDCDVFREFHEKIGNKFNATTDEGWRNLLGTYLQQPLNRAITEATQGMTWEALYSDSAAKKSWEEAVNKTLPNTVNQAMGGAYFKDFTITLQKPILPDDLLKALQDTQTAVQQNKAQEERNKQIETELASIRALVAVLGPDGYNTYQAIKDGRISVMPIPQGAGVNLNAPAGK